MSISRWEPWSDMVTMRDAMDQFVRESFARPRMAMDLGIALDVMDTNDAFVVDAVLPGIKPEDVQLQIKDDVLMISGDVKDEHDEKQGNWLQRERRFGHFQRSVRLPGSVDADNVNATFRDGMLHIMLPKSRESRARSIPVKAN